MSNYNAIVLEKATGKKVIYETTAETTKEAREKIMAELAEGDSIITLNVERERKVRDKASCEVTVVTVERNADGMFELHRFTQTVYGTRGEGKNAERDIRLFAKQAGEPLPKGAMIESIKAN